MLCDAAQLLYFKARGPCLPRVAKLLVQGSTLRALWSSLQFVSAAASTAKKVNDVLRMD